MRVTDKKYLFFKSQTLTQSLITLLLVIMVFAFSVCRAQVTIKKEICASETEATYVYHDIEVPHSDTYCNSASWVYADVVSHPDGLVTDAKAILIEGVLGYMVDCDAQVTLKFDPNISGYATIDISYKKNRRKGWFRCIRTGKRYLYTYEVHHEYVEPLGEYSGTFEGFAASDLAESVFEVTYLPRTDYPSGMRATSLIYKNGRLDENKNPIEITVPITSTEIMEEVPTSDGTGTYQRPTGTYKYDPVPITFYTKGRGPFSLTPQVYEEKCGTLRNANQLDVEVYSTCYKDDLSNVAITVKDLATGLAVESGVDGFHVDTEKQYTLEVTGVNDANGVSTFYDHFSWQTDGGSDITLDKSTGNFTIHNEYASYRIEALPNDVGCPTKFIQLYDNGFDTQLTNVCTITLPDALGKLPQDIVLHHFAKYVKSERSITVMPGIELEEGAELFIEPGTPTVDPASTDKVWNFTDLTTYDEYGRVLSASRNYFDYRGAALQSQYKNMTSGVLLAQATIKDAQGHPAISTLPAPIRVSEALTCPEDNGDINFGYKEDFIKSEASEGSTPQVYNYTHFDLANETTPVAVDQTTEGTLGWYYGPNNNASSTSKLKEDFVANTKYPYSRTLYYDDPSEGVKGVTKPGDIFKAGSGYLATSEKEAVTASDSYLADYLSIRLNELHFANPTSLDGEFFKTIVTDEVGKKSVGYTDKSGHTIMGLYFGTSTSSTPITKSYNYYDNAGRLLVSISPNGLFQYTGSNFSFIDKTTYSYNSRGLLKEMTAKDGGRTAYLYRKDGNIRFSQNEEQRKNTSTHQERYSYTNYDDSGRPVESGEYIVGIGGISFLSISSDLIENTQADGGLLETTGTKHDRIFTFYDEPDIKVANPSTPESQLPDDRIQRFVHGGVSYTKKDDLIKTWYSYDERGRVEWMVQSITSFGQKTIDYRYGPTGQVQEVLYQKGSVKADRDLSEQFTHFYEYDNDGRLYKVYTTHDLLTYDKYGRLTNDGVIYDALGNISSPGPLELQATYTYYLHGPLKRVELANKLQGIDYSYTVDGAVKGINHSDPNKDPGKDDPATNGFMRDAFGMSLDYYTGDYKTSDGTIDALTNVGDDQFTGLVKDTRWHSAVEPSKQFAYTYLYDQRGQFTDANWGSVTGTSFTPNSFKPYYEGVGSYDANGNINSLKRNFDRLKSVSGYNHDLTYNYEAFSNKLHTITNPDNSEFRSYVYNDLGQTTKQTEAGVSKFITYDVTGKVTGVYSDAEYTQPITTFVYDDRGFRLSKKNYDENGEATFCTWYVRDASGNVVGTYDDDLSGSPEIEEIPIYGSGRIGLYKSEFGINFYELTDHLGNVRAVLGKPDETNYLATMESERATREGDPEQDAFTKLRSDITSTLINHTPAIIEVDGVKETISDPNEVYRMNNVPNGNSDPDPIGVGKMIMVEPGDIIDADVYVKYANFNSSNTNLISGIAGFLTSAFPGAPLVDGVSVFANPNSASALIPSGSKLNNAEPMVFLNYLLYDNEGNLIKPDFAQATNSAVTNFQQLALNVTIEKEGYIYIYVSNLDDQNMEVYFDDLHIRHQQSRLVAGGDFYPYGLTISDRQILRHSYRYGYQGRYSEKDDETGWSHFEAREYDPVIGRWTVPDPAGQYHSPYLGMGNNPVIGVDKDGRFFGTIIGGLIGAGVAAWRGENVWKGALSGAVAGAVFDLVVASGGTVGVFIVAGAAAGASGNLVDQGWEYAAGDRNSFDAKGFATSTAVGAVIGPAFKLVGNGLGRIFRGRGIVIPDPPMTVSEAAIELETIAAKEAKLIKISEMVIDQDAMIFSAKVGDETIEVTTNFMVENGKLYLNKLHIGGNSKGKLDRKSLWNIAKELGKQYDVKEVIIQGGVRSTGKYVGQLPSAVTIKLD